MSHFLLCTVLWYLIGLATSVVALYFHGECRVKELLQVLFMSLFGPILSAYAFYIWMDDNRLWEKWMSVKLWEKKK